MERELAVVTTSRSGELELEHSAAVTVDHGDPTVTIHVSASSPRGGALVVSVRPYNPEGVQFIDRIKTWESRDGWTINGEIDISLSQPADRLLASTYAQGDVFSLLADVGGTRVKRKRTARSAWRPPPPSTGSTVRRPHLKYAFRSWTN
jgi:hypothetical protein